MTRRFERLICTVACALILVGCSQQRAVHMIERSGDRAVSHEDYALAASEYREIIERQPGRWDVRTKLASALLEMDQPNAAREQLEVAYTLRPTEPRVLELLAQAMLESGDIEAMTRELRFAAEESGRASDWYRMGVFLNRAGDDDGAERALLTAARLDGGQRAVYQAALARFYASVGDLERSLERYRMALYLAPEDETLLSEVRAMGQVPGPTFALQPSEQHDALP